MRGGEKVVARRRQKTSWVEEATGQSSLRDAKTPIINT